MTEAQKHRLYAHTVPDSSDGEWQTLSDHLFAVSRMAGEFAEPFGAEEWARLVGLVHDAGKASDAFQRRLQGVASHVDHSTAGAQLLGKRYGQLGQYLAYLVSGHHGGLPNWIERGRRTPLKERLAKAVEPYDSFFDIVDLPSVNEMTSAMPALLQDKTLPCQRAFSMAFLLKVLFSCLVDADYLDSERVMDREKSRLRGYSGISLSEMQDVLARHIASFSKQHDDYNQEVFDARADIYASCVEAAAGRTGLYSLTVPTGGGKTLSSLAFALAHALHNGQQRVIYAVPFTSIIEQNASVFKKLFGVDSVLEHHSNYNFDDSEYGDEESVARQRLAMENWDVPLVVTTNVQLFESIYTAKTSRSRKLHNIANSVIVLDEVQALPDSLLEPCLAAIEELCTHYSTTVVLCTATQPALEAVWPFSSRPTEIVPSERQHVDLFANRAKIESIGTLPLDELADELAARDQVLCIVSSRRAASSLYDALSARCGDEQLYHLSALMVPEHRGEVITQIKKDLAEGRACRVVSTQLIEAGVDIDFPVVFRETAGIDSVLQAAGRCNREGKGAVGIVRVFSCPDLALVRGSWLVRMRAIGEEIIERNDDPFGPEGVKAFFERRYSIENTDAKEVYKCFSDVNRAKGCRWNFEHCGNVFRFIEDEGESLIVPWGVTGANLVERLQDGYDDIGLARELQRFAVSVYERDFKQLNGAGRIVRHGPFNVLNSLQGDLAGYSDKKGLVVDEVDMTLLF